jgi:oligopeptide transport system ATP-binding protein
MNSFIEIKSLTVEFLGQKKMMAKDISLTRGGHYPLLGPNGCGKTTFLKSFLGLYQHSSDDIFLEGKKIIRSDFSWRKETIFYEDYLQPEWETLTIGELIDIYQVDKELWGAEKIKSLLKMVIKNKEDLQRPFFSFSTGQRQLFLTLLSCALPREIILLDEPLSSLDYPLKGLVALFLKEWAQQTQKLIIFSSHDWPIMKEHFCKSLCFEQNALVLLETKSYIDQYLKD